MKNSNNKNSIIIGNNNNLTINLFKIHCTNLTINIINKIPSIKTNLFKIHCIVTIFCLSSSLILQLLGFANEVSEMCQNYLNSSSIILPFNKIFILPAVFMSAINICCLNKSKRRFFNFFTYISLLVSSATFFYILFMPADFSEISCVYIIISYINIICLKLISKDERRI